MNRLILVRAAHGLLAVIWPSHVASWYGAPEPGSSGGRPGRGAARAGAPVDATATGRHKVVVRALRVLGARQLLEVLLMRLFRGSHVHTTAQAGDVLHAVSMLVVARRWPRLRRPALTSAALAVGYVSAAQIHQRRRTRTNITETALDQNANVRTPGKTPGEGHDDPQVARHKDDTQTVPPCTLAPAPPISTPSRPVPGRNPDALQHTPAPPAASQSPPASPSRTGRSTTVRPRVVWAGVAVIFLGMLAVGPGMVTSAPWLWTAGIALLLAGGVTSRVGGIMRDTHSTQAAREELAAAASGTRHEGTSADDMRHSPEAGQIADGTRELLLEREGSPLPLRFPAAVVLVLLGVWLQVGQWVLVYPFNLVGQNTALRDTGFAIVVTLAGFRLSSTRSPRASIIAVLSGLLLLAAAVFESHATTRGSVNELVTGALVVLAGLGAALPSAASRSPALPVADRRAALAGPDRPPARPPRHRPAGEGVAPRRMGHTNEEMGRI